MDAAWLRTYNRTSRSRIHARQDRIPRDLGSALRLTATCP